MCFSFCNLYCVPSGNKDNEAMKNNDIQSKMKLHTYNYIYDKKSWKILLLFVFSHSSLRSTRFCLSVLFRSALLRTSIPSMDNMVKVRKNYHKIYIFLIFFGEAFFKAFSHRSILSVEKENL